jgi:CelD/BcsL family acetyltransferase involved in cellulose biosynthesis
MPDLETKPVSELAVQVISTAEELGRLEIEWDELLAHSPGHRWFRSCLWQRTWWDVYHHGRRLELLTVRHADGQLVGIAPFQRRTVRYRGSLPFRRWEFLATGEDEADEIDSDYLDLILRDGWERPALDRILRHLTATGTDAWDEIVLERVPENSAIPRILQELAPGHRLRLMETQRAAGVLVPLPRTREEFIAGMGAQSRADYGRGKRLLAQEGELGFRWSKTAAEFQELWPIFVALHQKRWESQDRPGCFASPLFAEFHRRVASVAAAQGNARIAMLSVNGQPVAACYLFLSDGVVYHYQSGLDLRYGPKSSPGMTLIGHCLDAAIAEGLRTWDFLHGTQRYQRFWSKERQQQVSWRLSRPGPRETFRQLCEKTRSLVKRCLRQPPPGPS